jgi:pimeloyl-ACP methyl ester carboxylesterase
LSFVLVQGLSLHVQELGSGPPLVLTHGLLLDNLSSWLFSVASKLAVAHRVVLWDLRGHGRSDRAPSGYDAITQAADLAGVIDQLAPEGPVDLGGFSYGGLIALRYALDHRDRVGRLALLEAPLPPRSYSEFDPLLAGDLDALLAAMPAGLRAQVLLQPRRAMKLLASVRGLIESTSLLADVKGDAALPAGALAGLDLPVLCLYASRSPFLDDGHRLEAELPQARFQTLDAGHRLLNERPSEVATALTTFFQ